MIQTSHPIESNHSINLKKIEHQWKTLSKVWREVWGPHIHHGYYHPPSENITLTPQEVLLENLANKLHFTQNCSVLDVGCGMGESAIYFAKKYPIHITGINISDVQLEIAKSEAKKAKLPNVAFIKNDAHQMDDISDNSFDIVMSIESAEQYTNKALFVKQALRVLKPGGTFLLTTWCSDKESYKGLEAKEYLALCNTFCVPYMPTLDYYQELLSKDFHLLLVEDWSENVKASWKIGIEKLNQYSYFQLFKLSGFNGIKMIRKIDLLRNAFENGRVRYGVFLASKLKT